MDHSEHWWVLGWSKGVCEHLKESILQKNEGGSHWSWTGKDSMGWSRTWQCQRMEVEETQIVAEVAGPRVGRDGCRQPHTSWVVSELSTVYMVAAERHGGRIWRHHADPDFINPVLPGHRDLKREIKEIARLLRPWLEFSETWKLQDGAGMWRLSVYCSRSESIVLKYWIIWLDSPQNKHFSVSQYTW